MFSGEKALSVIGGTCAKCGGGTVFKADAIGRVTERCPKCDGVSAPTVMHPSLAGTPAPKPPAIVLPPIAPGQLRCQVCARGVEGTARFCDPCQPKRPPMTRIPMRPCLGCGRPTPRTIGRPRKDCDVCRV